MGHLKNSNRENNFKFKMSGINILHFKKVNWHYTQQQFDSGGGINAQINRIEKLEISLHQYTWVDT